MGYRSSKEAWKSEEGAGEQGRGGGGEGGEVCCAVRREWEREVEREGGRPGGKGGEVCCAVANVI